MCDEFWLVAKGSVSTFDGDLDDYQKWLQEQAREVAQAARAAREADRNGKAQPKPAEASAQPPAPSAPVPDLATPPVKSKEDRKAQAQARQRVAEQTKPLKAELKQLDQRMAKAHEEQAALTDRLSDPGLSGAERAEQGKRLKALGEEIETLESRWLELTDQIEQLET